MPFFFFLWSDEALEHLAEHGVLPEEFEEVVSDPEESTFSRSSGRPAAIGGTSTGKRLFCVYELDDDGITVHPITAYERD